jgi:RNA polymerase sigma factor (TIGR02999 family)
MPKVYDELRGLARKFFRRERPDHTLQPTALVHEAYLRLVDQTRIGWQGRTHFCAICARAMRQVLIDHARSRKRLRRGGERQKVLLDSRVAPAEFENVDVFALNEALEKLAALDARQAQVVELRFFGGLNVDEVAHVLGVSKRTVEGDWTHAKAWLRTELGREEDE